MNCRNVSNKSEFRRCREGNGTDHNSVAGHAVTHNRKHDCFNIVLVKAAVGLGLLSLIVAAKHPLTAQVGSADTGWVSIFNGKNLAGWYTYLPSTGRNSDPKGVFKIHDGMIHILDIPVAVENQEMGFIATEKEYSNCRIRLEYKWGQKRFPPRAQAPRDSGLLYHFVGPDKVWPRSVECQIMETDTGSFYLVDMVGATTTVESKENHRYVKGGVVYTEIGKAVGRIQRTEDYEDPAGWNTVEVILDGDRATHIINGKVANYGWDLRQPDPKDPTRYIPLAKGRLLLQAEGAEVFFRNIQVKLLH